MEFAFAGRHQLLAPMLEPLPVPQRGRPWKADGYTDRRSGPDAVRLPAWLW
jgi:hypothetical protein